MSSRQSNNKKKVVSLKREGEVGGVPSDWLVLFHVTIEMVHSKTHTYTHIKQSRKNNYSAHNEKYVKNVCNGRKMGGNHSYGHAKLGPLGFCNLLTGSLPVEVATTFFKIQNN